MGKAKTSRARRRAPTAKQALVFEIAWEVCQQLGGIYTVMRSKAPRMAEYLGDRYFMLGPYHPERSAPEFEESEPDPALAPVLANLAERDIEARYGHWLITGRPRCVLLSTKLPVKRLDEIKHAFWKRHKIDLPTGDGLLDDVVVFGHQVASFFESLREVLPRKVVLAHFHEWMAGMALPELVARKLDIATVFTTHATLVGRHLAIHDPNFQNKLSKLNWEREAARFGIRPQAAMERLAARSATVLTTVSEVTAVECRHLLARQPEGILPNGLNIERYMAVHEFQNLHRTYKERIHQFVMGHFFPSYTFDLDKTIYFFTSGRYEYQNKGYDLTIEALSRLNWQLKRVKSDCTVVFLLVTRRDCHSINPDVLNRRAMMEEMRNTCQEIQRQVGEGLFKATARQESPSLDDLVEERWKFRLRHFMHAWRTDRLPPIVTHDLVDDRHDEVLNQLRASNLVNHPEDRVKIVYHPDFIRPSSPLFGLDYPQFVRGCHLGIFPSSYEPWGYTPMECAASGIPAVTSDFSGFGSYLLHNLPSHHRHGMYVVRRSRMDFSTAADDLADYLYRFLQLSLRERIKMRNAVEAFSEKFAWRHLIKHYVQVHKLALRKAAESTA